MNIFDQYKYLQNSFEATFKGLPYAHGALIKSLILLADPKTGIVSGITYSDLCDLLAVNPAPGRKESGTPTKQTIRNYIKSIERDCGAYFKVISDGQTLRFLFPELPKIFRDAYKNTEVNTDLNTYQFIDNIEENSNFDEEVNTHLNTEVNAPGLAVKNINILTNKHNKQTPVVDSENSKQPIQPDFYPSDETIATAISHGFLAATDLNEIKKFIKYNQDNNCLWADFNPVFLCWLERDRQYRQTKQQKQRHPQNIRSNTNERSSLKSNSYEAAMAAVINDNRDACSPSELFKVGAIIEGTSESPAHIVALDSINRHLRPALHQQTRNKGQRALA